MSSYKLGNWEWRDDKSKTGRKWALNCWTESQMGDVTPLIFFCLLHFAFEELNETNVGEGVEWGKAE